jgi:hypothetical protein
VPSVTLAHARDTAVSPEIKTIAEGVAQKSSPDTAFQVLDRALHAAMSQATLGLSRDFVSAAAHLNLRARFGLFISALKIPFPGNGDFSS